MKDEPTPSGLKVVPPSVDSATLPWAGARVTVYCTCDFELSGSKADSIAGVICAALPSVTPVSGCLTEPAGSGRFGVAAICGASFTLVIWMRTVALFDAWPQRSTASTLKLVLRTSEPSLTKRRPVLPAELVSSDASMSVPAVRVTQVVPLKYSSVPPGGSEVTLKRSAFAPVASLL